MEIRLRYLDACPSWRTACDRLGVVLRELGLDRVPVHLERVRTRRDAERLRFVGSPTILVDGHDIFPSSAEQYGLSCRVYETPDGLAGSPTLDQLRRVLAEKA